MVVAFDALEISSRMARILVLQQGRDTEYVRTAAEVPKKFGKPSPSFSSMRGLER